MPVQAAGAGQEGRLGRRRFRKIALGLLVGLPLLAWLVLQAYVRFGLLTRSVNTSLVERFGPGAGIDSTELHGLSGLEGHRFALPDRLEPRRFAARAASLKAEWNLWDILLRGRLSSLEILRPELTLRRNEEGAWNLELPRRGKTGIEIGQIRLRQGSLGVQWRPEWGLMLGELEADLWLPPAPQPSSATLRARWRSGHLIEADALLNRDGSLTLNAETTLDLSQDLCGSGRTEGGLAGLARFSLGARGEAPLQSSERARSIRVQGRLEMSGLRLEGAGRNLAQWPALQSDFSATLHFPPGPVAPPRRISELRLGAQDLLEFQAGEVTVEPAGRRLDLRQGSATLFLPALFALFGPAASGFELAPLGRLRVEDLAVSLPWGEAAPFPQGSCGLRSEGLGLRHPKVGALPALSLRANLQAGKEGLQVGDGELGVEALGKCRFEGRLEPGAFRDGGLSLETALKALHIQELSFDFERLADTEFGRRILSGQPLLAGSQPPPREGLAWLPQGTVSATDLRLEERSVEGQTCLASDGVRLGRLGLLRWPLGSPVPEMTVSGELAAQLFLREGRLERGEFQGSLRSDSDPPLATQLRLELASGERGKVLPRRIVLGSLGLPLAQVARILGLEERLTGLLSLTQGSYDFQDRTLEGEVQLVDAGFATRWAGLSLQGLFAKSRIQVKDRRLLVRGQLDSGSLGLFAELPLLGKLARRGLPKAEFELSADLGPLVPPAAGQPIRGGSLKLSWGENPVRSLELQATLSHTQEEPWVLRGGLKTDFAGGMEGGWELAWNSQTGTLGPLTLQAKNVNLAGLQAGLGPLFSGLEWECSGQAPELKLEVEPLQWRGLPALLGSEWTAVCSGRLQQARLAHLPSRSEAERLTGEFRANLRSSDGGSSWTLNGLLRLEDYELLAYRQLYLPPPEAGHPALLQLVGQLRKDPDQAREVRLDKLHLNLSDLLTLEASTGRLRIPRGKDPLLDGEGLLQARVEIPDLARAQKILGQPNLKIVTPLLAAARLEGGLVYEGRQLWGPDRLACCGVLRFRRVQGSLRLDERHQLRVQDLEGTLPLAFHDGNTLWPADWSRNQQGTLSFRSIELPPLSLARQPLELVATPNLLSVARSIQFQTPGGAGEITGLRAQQLLGREPAIRFGVHLLGLSLAELAEQEGWKLQGLQGTKQRPEAVLRGKLPHCSLVRRAGPVGAWTLETEGHFEAPCYRGQVQVGGFHGRGFFGSAPVWGCWLRVKGLDLGTLTRMNPRFGRLNTVADLQIEEFSAVGLQLEDAQSFQLSCANVPREEVTDYYDGRLALFVARTAVEETLRKLNVTENWLVDQRFSFRRLALGFQLQAGQLRGPLPGLEKNLVLDGKGLFSPDIEGTPGRFISWSEVVSSLRAHESKVKALPEPKEVPDGEPGGP